MVLADDRVALAPPSDLDDGIAGTIRVPLRREGNEPLLGWKRDLELLCRGAQHGPSNVRLAARGVLSTETAARLHSLAGFRNVLVHDYADVDLSKVHAALDRLPDFEAFIADVERWLTDEGSGSPAGA